MTMTDSTSATASGVSHAIESDGLVKIYGKRRVVDDVSLRVPTGSTYGLIGLNGAGKSTTIRMLMGLIQPTAGTARLQGRPASGLAWESRLGVGYVPDRCMAHPWMTVRQAIDYCAALQPRWNVQTETDLLGRMRLDVRQRVSRLSKGMAAKLSLVLALAHDPDVLILDEPTDGLDPVAKEDFLESVLASTCERSRTILLSSHSLGEVQRLTDFVGLMHEGRLVLQRSTEELVRTTRRVRIATDEPARPSRPAGAIHDVREGREWSVTITDYGDDAAKRLAESVKGRVVSVDDLSLEDIFKDFVRGQEAGR